MGTITPKIFKAAYDYGKMVYEKQISKRGAISTLGYDYGMNIKSANEYIRVFKLMMIGGEIKRQNNGPATEYYLKSILHDYGPCQLKLALQAVLTNIKYYKSMDKPLLNHEAIYNKYLDILNKKAQSMW
jgi:hypothetical protein